MSSLRARASYLQIDHRESPGFDSVTSYKLGIGKKGIGSVNFETNVVHCCGCSRGILLNTERTRERAICRKCNSYQCDWCAAAINAGAIHVPIDKFLDEKQEAAFRAEQRGQVLIL
jgi:hypothetical protein